MNKRSNGMNRYLYDGPVIDEHGESYGNMKAVTMAPTENKARNNFIYRFKQENGVFRGTRLILPGKIIMEE